MTVQEAMESGGGRGEDNHDEDGYSAMFEALWRKATACRMGDDEWKNILFRKWQRQQLNEMGEIKAANVATKAAE